MSLENLETPNHNRDAESVAPSAPSAPSDEPATADVAALQPRPEPFYVTDARRMAAAERAANPPASPIILPTSDVPLLDLLDRHHLDRLLGFTTPEIVRERGYWTARDNEAHRRRLRSLGFSDKQIRGFPILVIPTWFDSAIVTYELRPDTPRLRDGKPCKYDSVPKSAKRLNVLQRYREMLRDPKVPLLLTEGSKKGDALAKVFPDAAVASISGVTGWRGRNDYGGVTLLADFDHVALNERAIFLFWDIDLLTNKNVHRSMTRLQEILENKGAVVYVPDWTKLPEILREREAKANGY